MGFVLPADDSTLVCGVASVDDGMEAETSTLPRRVHDNRLLVCHVTPAGRYRQRPFLVAGSRCSTR